MAKSGSDTERLRVLNARAWEQSLSEPEVGERTATEAVELARSLRDLDSEIAALLNRGWSRIVQADYQHAQDDLEIALRLAQEVDPGPDTRCKLHNALGAAFHGKSELGKAIGAYQESLAIAERTHLPLRQIAALNNLGEVEMDLGHVGSARGLFEQAERLLEQYPDRETEVVVFSNLGDLAMREDDLEEAERFFAAAREAAEEVGDRFNEGELLSRLGVLAARRGDAASAERYHTESIRMAQDVRSPVIRASALMNLGDLHRQLDQPEMARVVYEQAREHAEEINARHLSYRLHRRLAELAEERDDLAMALTDYKRYMFLKSELQDEWTEHRLQDLTRTIEAERLRMVGEIAQEITATLDLDEILERIYRRINRVLDAKVFSIGLYDAEHNALEYPLVIENGRRGEPRRVPVEPGTSFGAWVVEHHEAVIIEDLRAQYGEYLNAYPQAPEAQGDFSGLYMPLTVKDRLVGVLSVQTTRLHAYSELDIRIVRTLAAFLAIAIDNSLIIDRVTVLNRLMVQEKDELRQAYEQISELANRDHLTGLANRRIFQQYVAAHLERRRDSREPLAILFIDLDQFKPINDTYGHQAGDRVLQEVAARLTAETRTNDLVGRIGGDEFVVVLPEGASVHAVEATAAKVKAAVERPIVIADSGGRFTGEVCVSASTGYARFPDNGTSYDQLVRHADAVMYGEKRARA